MLIHLLLIAFVVAATVLWASVFGYIGLLVALSVRTRRSRGAPRGSELPAVTVVVSVYNEAGFIAAKLADLQRAEYPRDRLRVLVVDRGSTDGSAALVEAARAGGAAVDLLHAGRARGKTEQLNEALAGLSSDIIIVTDADARLDPRCIRELVGALQTDPSTAIVGARVHPATRLLEERMHWWLLNWLWWLEGEALGLAMVSGVCFALRRTAVVAMPGDCTAEDVHLALAATADGSRVRLCRRAVATELRVPQSAGEFLRFRRRRGMGYVRELLRARPAAPSLAWRCVRWLRLAHFVLVPPLAAALVAAALVLCATPHWHVVAACATGFVVPTLAALYASTTLGSSGRHWWHLSLAAGRLAGLTWFALLALQRTPDSNLMQGD